MLFLHNGPADDASFGGVLCVRMITNRLGPASDSLLTQQQPLVPKQVPLCRLVPEPELSQTTRARRLIDRKQLVAWGIDFSRMHLSRLEAANKFPRRAT